MTKLFGVLGWPIGHSASPVMMKAAFTTLSEDAVYLPFAVRPDDFADALTGLRALGAVGVNVTIPHKQAAWQSMTEVTAEAELAQAVNTVLFAADGRFIGHNTDALGWWKSVAPALDDSLENVVVLGTGGAARAVLAALCLYLPVAKVQVVGRDAAKTQVLRDAFADRLHVETGSWQHRHKLCADGQLVVNTTSVGMWPNDTDSVIADESCFSAQQVVQDVVYRPQLTRFLSQAQKRGATVVGGLPMLVGQGAAALEFWLKRAAPFEAMLTAATQFLSDSTQH